MGVVYRARDPRLDRAVAIKVISPAFATDASRIARFEQEARSAGQLNHPNVLTVYDVGLHAGTPYIVAELLEGETLRARLERSALSPQKAVDYARQAAAGLAAAHDRHIVHRDVKPENLFITIDGRIKILDFGIVKLTTPEDDRSASGSPTDTSAGAAAGTAAYMSPEQVRGEPVDVRSDIFSVGAVLHEMLTGRPAFARGTPADTMVAILREEPEPPLPPGVSPGVERIVSRCLDKAREARFQSARDLAFGLEVLSDTQVPSLRAPLGAARRSRLVIGATALLVLLTAGAAWLVRGRPPQAPDNVLANATFSRVTDWVGTESGAEISPDGRFVAFVSDRDGPLNLFETQVGTGHFVNLTSGLPPLTAPAAIMRTFGFSGDGADIWITAAGDASAPKSLIPVGGGTPRAFLGRSRTAPSWSPDGTRLAFFTNGDGDPLYVADRTGADAQPVRVDDPAFYARGAHNHNPVWSADGKWLYFAHGSKPTEEMDIWRVRPSGGTPERLTTQHVAINLFTLIDERTVLFIAHAENGSGPWLWSLDVETKQVRRVTSGLEHYSSVSASEDGRRIVVTVANPTATLWSVPLLDRIAQDRDVQRYAQANARAIAPRFGKEALFYLSDRGAGDGLWRESGGQAAEIWKAPDDSLSEPPAISPDGTHVAVVARRGGQRHLVVMAPDGTDARTLAPSIVIRGSGGQGSLDWSPDGAWIVAATDAGGGALMKIPVNGGAPVRLVSGQVINPIWSPKGTLIVYGGPIVGGQVTLLAVRPDGTSMTMPKVLVRLGGGHRFLRDGSGIVFLARDQSLDFRLLDLKTNATRLLTHLSDQGALHTFDIAPDGRSIVFDRSRENSDIYLIDLPGR
jgi:Tol biopolymer transport system component